ncbi:MAG: SDR family NAD(P)-dependent oxidoreductase, partial [Myxococcales bacterium]|nr:SDR family NAD(P)-dependent oxidoreductase [Myxococcales bacterium]
VREATGNSQVDWTLCDLSSLDSVRAAAQTLNAEPGGVDVLINNAAVFELGYAETPDGFERHLGVNFLAPFLLTHLLLPGLLAASAPRVVNVSGETARFACVRLGDLSRKRSFGWSSHWGTFAAYGQSKLALILWTRLWAQRFAPAELCINAIHPGMVGTAHLAGGPRWLDRAWRALGGTPQRAAGHIARVALDPRLEGKSGRYYAGGWRFPPPLLARSQKKARSLYAQACELTGLMPA